MTTTTGYGTWNNHGDSGNVTVKATVADALTDWADEYDIDAIVTQYRAAINEALPESMHLVGEEFIGPAFGPDWDVDDYPTDSDDVLDIAAIVASVDLWVIVARNEKAEDTATYTAEVGDENAEFLAVELFKPDGAGMGEITDLGGGVVRISPAGMRALRKLGEGEDGYAEEGWINIAGDAFELTKLPTP